VANLGLQPRAPETAKWDHTGNTLLNWILVLDDSHYVDTPNRYRLGNSGNVGELFSINGTGLLQTLTGGGVAY
jgi:hypothetical protein